MLSERIKNIHQFIDEGKLEEALTLLREASRSFPAHAPLFILLAETSEKVGRQAEALNAWQHAWFLVPNSTYIRQQLDRLIPRPMDGARNRSHHAFNPNFERKAPPLNLPVTPKIVPPPLPTTTVTTRPIQKPIPIPPPLPPHVVVKKQVVPEVPSLPQASFPPAPEPTQPAPTDAFSLFMAPEGPSGISTSNAPPSSVQTLAPVPNFSQLAALEQPQFEIRTDFTWEPPKNDPLIYPEVSWHTLKETLGGIDPPARLQPKVEIETPFDNLDDLISQLENAPRIVPNATTLMDELPPAPDEGDTEDMVSETLARIYATQRQYKESEEVYRRLADLQPQRAAYFIEKAAEMVAKIEENRRT